MNVMLDGASILIDNWQLTSGMVAFVFIGQGLIRLALSPIFGDELTAGEYSSLGIAGWMTPILIISLIWILWGMDHAIQFGLLILTVFLLLLFRLKSDTSTGSGRRPKPAPASTSLFFPLFVVLYILLRLAYISRATFPFYFDSAQHYSIIKNIMGNGGTWVLNWLTTNYYHLGFHLLTAFFASIFPVETTRAMLILGQVILALIPFSIYFLVRHETRSDMAGWFAIVLSAFGWYMPAHAVDWGKYPALMGMGLIPFVLSLAYLLLQDKKGPLKKKHWTLYGMLGVSALLSIFAHSRSLIVFGIVFLAWITATWRQKLPQRRRSYVFVIVVVITLLEAVFLLGQNVLALVFDPYLHKGVLITVFVLLLSFFVWMDDSRLAFVCVLTVTLLLAGLFIPVTWIPGYRDLTLLDRPFVEMILFLPLSLLGGLGLAGLEKKLQGRFSWGRYVGLFATGIVLVNAFFTYNLYPSDCCVIVGNDDVVAMDWMAKQLPVDARIGIASTELKVMASESFEGDVGADAGIWIAPLTGRLTLPFPYDMEFDQPPALQQLCELGISHLYVGEAGQTFDNARLDFRTEWYRPLLSMPKTRVYEVIGCDN